MSHEECEISSIHECYCPACQGDQATTTVLLTKVPYFREILLMNLSCAVCGYRIAESFFGGEIQDKGHRITLTVMQSKDFNRQIVKSDSASIFLPALKLEIPATTQKGKITTLEGILRTVADQLSVQQSERLLLGDVDNFHRCVVVIDTLRRWTGQTEITLEDKAPLGLEHTSIFPFDVILDDPVGNSFIENLQAPKRDPQLNHTQYFRTPEQDACLGIVPALQAKTNLQQKDATPHYSVHASRHETLDSLEHWDSNDEVMKFPTTCPNCRCSTETNMCLINIPHFQQVILMCMVCPECGYRSNDIQGNNGAISEYGTRLTLNVTDMDDLSRDVLKSNTAAIRIPEIDLEIEGGSLGGLYSTVEGILTKIVDHLETMNPFGMGDSAEPKWGDGGPLPDGDLPDRYRAFLKKTKEMMQGRHVPFRLILSDPLSNSFVGPRRGKLTWVKATKTGSPQHIDQNLILETYNRTDTDNEILGLCDIVTEGYEQRQVPM